GYELNSVLKNIFKIKKKQFIILIDEWDALFRLDKDNVTLQEKYISFLRSLFKGSNAEEFVALAYITGILPIKKYGGESALNNFKEYTVAEPLLMTEYIGFTEDEVKKLCDEYDMDFSEMHDWYDGYKFYNFNKNDNSYTHIYSPNSVCNAIDNRRYKDYWVSTETYESLKLYISLNFEGLKDDIITMLACGKVKADVGLFTNDLVSFGSKDEVLACLVHLGYLAYDAKTEEVFIPNKEVRTVFERAIKTSKEFSPVMKALTASEQLMKYTLEKNADKVAEAVATAHANATSIKKYNDENSLSCAITLAYYVAMNDYELIREMPSGVGFADIVFLPRSGVVDKPVLVVELKCDKTATTAFNQIKDRKYGDHLKDYTGKILLIGINYDKDDKNKIHTCVIEELEKTE
ncbi:MAG: ATP-binding protein, partial [Lachnospiraceae bacterium]|nr:ATP-binding protein [Lachnospiraceae bacterium]